MILAGVISGAVKLLIGFGVLVGAGFVLLGVALKRNS